MSAGALAAVALWIAGCSSSGPEERLAKAKQLLGKQDVQSAVIQLKSLLHDYPDAIEARFLLGRLSADLGDFPTAERELRRASESAYRPDEVAHPFARALLELNQPEKVLKDIDPAKVADPTARGHLETYRARALFRLSKFTEAAQLIDEVLRRMPEFGPALVTRAQLQAQGNDVTAALQTLTQVLAKNERDVEALVLKATIDKVQGRDADATGALERAIAAAPNLTGPRAALASMLLEQDKLAEVRVQVDALRKLPNGQFEAVVLESQLAYREKKFEHARNTAVQALKADPNHLPALVIAASSEYALGNLGPAEAALQKIVRQTPQHAPSRKFLADVLIKQNNFDAAQQVLQPLLSAESMDGQALSLAGEAALQSGDLEAAQKLFRRVAEANPKDVRARAALAASQVLTGNSTSGIAELERIGVQAQDQFISDVMLVLVHHRAHAWEKALGALAVLERKQPDNSLTYNLRGSVLGAKGDFAGARQAFERAVALNPRHALAVVNLARLDAREGRPARAKQQLEAFLSAHPSNARALVTLAELKAQLGATRDEVGRLLEKARHDNPRLLPPRLALVQWHTEGGEYRKAIDLAQETEWAFPNVPEVLLALGRAQLATGDTSQAIATYRKLVQAHGRNADGYLGLAQALAAGKDLDGARKALERTLQIEPQHAGAQLALIEVEALADRVPRAMEMLSAFHRAHPKSVGGYTLEGDIQARSKNYGPAAGAYAKALALRAATPVAIKYHDALLAAGQRAAAADVAADWVKQHPKDASFRLYLAQIMLSARDYEGAKRAFIAVLELQPPTSGILNNLAWACYKTKDAKALAYAEQAYKLGPNDASVLDTLGAIRLERGETTVALELLAKAVALAPKSPSIRYNYANALAQAGKKEEARRELVEALEMKIPFDELEATQKLLAGM